LGHFAVIIASEVLIVPAGQMGCFDESPAQATAERNQGLQTEGVRSPMAHQEKSFTCQITYGTVFFGVDVALGKNTQNQHLSKKEGIVLIIGMLDCLLLFHSRWIGQMKTIISAIHQTVYQPVPVVGGFNDKTLELILERFQCLYNQRQIIGNSFCKNSFELFVHNPDKGIS
jgi:hypothetical protein